MSVTLVYIFLLSIVASFIQRTAGFGYGIFIMTVLPFLMPSYAEATALSGLLAMANPLYVTIKMHKQLEWKKLLPILIPSLVISTICIICLNRIEDKTLRMVLGVVLMLVSLYFIYFSNRIRLRDTPLVSLAAGSLAGAMGGFFGMQGPPAVLYYISTTKDKNEYLVLTQAFMLFGNILMSFVRACSGFMTSAVGYGFIFGLAGVAIGAPIGAYVFDKLPIKIIRYIVYAYIGISGIIIFVTG
jgi:uncharacterized membrane protein YfcA